MSEGPASTIELDRRAAALLDRLLVSGPAAPAELDHLSQTDPALHARVLELLRERTLAVSTAAFAAPLAAALAAVGGQVVAGERIAGYRLLKELGRGGMSTVWQAERADADFRREVALKLPLAPHLSGVLAERFARERDVLAALDHPNIARLFDAGVAENGRPFIVLELVDGLPLTEYAVSRQLSTHDRLALFLQVLAAVEHAHARMVVHRDLKPSNILVDTQGRAKLLDFGIAKLLALPEGEAPLTQEAGALMTPRYAAPEQVLGQPVTAATDIYSAGVVLYELLTGRMPYGAPETTSLQLMQAVTEVEPRVPRLSTDIDTVLLKALAKDPAQRYASVERFAEDIRRLLDDRPILARRVPPWRRAALLVKRHRKASVAAAAAVLLLAAFGATAWQQARESAAQRARADAVRDFVFSMVADAEPAEGRSDVTGREMVDAAAARARREVADPRLRGELLGELGRVYFRLQMAEASQATLEEAIALLAPRVRADDPPLNRARAVLARTLLNRDAERAAALARQALADCTRADRECADARGAAHYALAALASWRGDHEESVVQARALVEETRVSDGPKSTPMALALETLATTARNGGHLDEASKAIEQAQAIAADRVMRAANRNRLDLIAATIDHDLGRYAPARERLRALLARPAAEAERVIQWRWLSAVELQAGDAPAALAAAEAARAAQRPDAPAVDRAATEIAWANASSKLGRHDDALPSYDRALERLSSAGFPPNSGFVVRARRLRAEALLRQGSTAPALAELQSVAADLAGGSDRVERARALDALGCALARSGEAAQAAQRFDEAAALWKAAFAAEHPLRRRHEALRQAADCRTLL